MNDVKVILCDEKNDAAKIKVWAEINGGSLKISGQEFSSSADSVFGSSEYEYFYNFDNANTDRLLSLLTDNGTNFETALVSRFGGVGGCALLRDFCAETSIKYEFFTYS